MANDRLDIAGPPRGWGGRKGRIKAERTREKGRRARAFEGPRGCATRCCTLQRAAVLVAVQRYSLREFKVDLEGVFRGELALLPW